MKKLLLVFCIAGAFASCQQSNSNQLNQVIEKAQLDSTGAPLDLADAPKFSFDKEIFDFGVIKDGETVAATFKFKNTGKTPLIISDATATCGCTVPEYPQTPVKPGEEGIISVKFHSAGKVGMQDKVITLRANSNPNEQLLHLVGEVVENKK